MIYCSNFFSLGDGDETIGIDKGMPYQRLTESIFGHVEGKFAQNFFGFVKNYKNVCYAYCLNLLYFSTGPPALELGF